MKISVFGLGYVGAVTCGCLTERGHHVVGVDVQSEKVDALNRGEAPILEPELGDLLASAKREGLLEATTDTTSAIHCTEVSIVCVGTPSLDSGGLDLRYVREVCRQIASALETKTTSHLLLLRSTMLPGSTRDLAEKIFEPLLKRKALEIVFCPEFLREGTAINDFREPSLAVMGSVEGKRAQAAEDVMGQANWLPWEGAEMVKYACNYWHAVKVCFANEIGRASKRAGVNGQQLMRLLCEDTRLNISTYYMRPGNPFGGSCLPKDVSALRSYAAQHGLVLPLLDAVKPSNAAHADRLKDLVVNLGGQRILILGVAFKENTDDLRQSPMVALAESLLSEGFDVQLYDPKIKPAALVGANRTQANRRLPSLESLLQTDLSNAIGQADTLVVLYPTVKLEELRALLREDQHVVDVNGWADLRTLPARYVGFCW